MFVSTKIIRNCVFFCSLCLHRHSFYKLTAQGFKSVRKEINVFYFRKKMCFIKGDFDKLCSNIAYMTTIFNPKSSVMRVIRQILDTYKFYPKILFITHKMTTSSRSLTLSLSLPLSVCMLLYSEKYKPNTRKLHKYSIRRLANVFITFSYQNFSNQI